jgi:succinate dehydrogenase/fumarate reductase flavoprotein subunit
MPSNFPSIHQHHHRHHTKHLSKIPKPQYDVIVIGSGNAGFSAALSAVDNGARKVLLVDKAPAEWAGGNSYFTAGAFRTVFHGLEDVLSFVQPVAEETARKIDMQAYTAEDFWDDLMRVTEGRADKELGRVLVGESRETIGWLASKGIKFQLSFNRCHL